MNAVYRPRSGNGGMIATATPPLAWESHHGRVVRCFAQRPDNLAAALADAVARAPDAEALVDGERRLTYRQLTARVDALAAGLADMGVQSGDRVALLLANRLECPLIFFACAAMGAIVVPMNLRQSADETAFVLNQSGAVVLFHEVEARLPAPDAVPALRACLIVTDDGTLPAGTPRPFAPVDEDAPVCILYTSGTTGRPKGAVLSHFNLIHTALHYRHHYALRDGERSVLAVPASHVTGLAALIIVSVGLAGCLILMREFHAGRFIETAVAERMTYTLIVPTMIALMLMHPQFDGAALSAWRVCGFGGAPMSDTMIAELAHKLPGLALHNTYGATETSSPAVIMPKDQAVARNRQLGLPVLAGTIAVMDERGHEVPRGTQGEIWISGPMVVPGYWDNPEATAAAFVGSFWKSGDLGSMDADGFISLHDRIKDMINRGGFKIYSVEVENVLCRLPAVIEAAVIGKPCPVLGERVVAFVHLDPSSDPIDAEAMRAHCSAFLSDYKVPETFVVDPAPLPRNANGKLLKTTLRTRLQTVV